MVATQDRAEFGLLAFEKRPLVQAGQVATYINFAGNTGLLTASALCESSDHSDLSWLVALTEP